MKEKFYKLFSADIGIDLGTANTLVYVAGHGIVVNEPSVVAINQKTGRVVAVGNDARQMIGRTPVHLSTIRPLVNGVISDFEVTEEMVSYFLRKAREAVKGKPMRPRVIVGVPCDVTNVERRAVRDVVFNAGAREVLLIEQPMSAAIGIRLPINDPVGSMVIDIGGGTSDIAVISLGGIVRSKSLHIAGDRLNQDIASYVRDEFKMLLGDRTAEETKIAVGAVGADRGIREVTVRGRDLVTALPREVVLTDEDIREAIAPSITVFVHAVREVLESTPPEVISDIMRRGIVLVGGGAMITGLSQLLSAELKIPILIAEDPLTAVVRGMGIVLDDLSLYKEALIDHEDDYVSS